MAMVILQSDKRAREKPCLRCGYSLRHIESDRCPECGLRSYISLSGIDALDMSNPAWLRRLSIACCVLMTSFAIMAAERWHGLWSALYHLMGWRVFDIVLVVQLALHQAGLLMLCRPEGRYPDRLAPWRTVVWIVTAIVMLYAAAKVVLDVRYTLMGLGIGVYELWRISYGILTLANTALVWAILRPLARRLPSRRLIATLNLLLIGIAVYAIPSMCLFPGSGATRVLLWSRPIYMAIAVIVPALFAWRFLKAARSAEREWSDGSEA